MSKISGNLQDFIPNLNSTNIQDDHVIIQNRGAYNQISFTKFTKNKQKSDVHPQIFSDPNTAYAFSKPSKETTYEKMAKAHFNEKSRREYNEQRLANINVKSVEEVSNTILLDNTPRTPPNTPDGSNFPDFDLGKQFPSILSSAKEEKLQQGQTPNALFIESPKNPLLSSTIKKVRTPQSPQTPQTPTPSSSKGKGKLILDQATEMIIKEIDGLSEAAKNIKKEQDDLKRKMIYSKIMDEYPDKNTPPAQNTRSKKKK